jgi:beta-galactosidase
MFWGLSNETTTDDKDFGKTKIEYYTSLIKSLDTERLVGYVMSHSYNNPSSYYNNPNVDWFGCNIYVGWYIDKASNNPTSQLNTRVANIITNLQKPLAFSEYGAGGTQNCHSEDPQTTTTKGNYERHDIEYQMWLHEGHIAAIRNFPQLLFTAEWQLFDIAVSSRNEGYTICPDGETASTDDELRRLNNKGLVERDHITKKDTFYIYKAEWSSQLFVHICGKDYTRMTDRVIKCYTNAGNSASLYVNNTFIETVTVTDHIAVFTTRNFSSGDVVRVDVGTTSDTFTF